jgi:hypothetical protein
VSKSGGTRRLDLSVVEQAHALMLKIVELRKLEKAIEERQVDVVHVGATVPSRGGKNGRDVIRGAHGAYYSAPSWVLDAIGAARERESSHVVLRTTFQPEIFLPLLTAQITAYEHALRELGVEV